MAQTVIPTVVDNLTLNVTKLTIEDPAPSKASTGNNENLPHLRQVTPLASRHIPIPESPAQASGGNNNVEEQLDFTSVASENVTVGKGFIVDEIPLENNEEEKKKEAERKKFLDANNEEDASTIERAIESTVYQEIPTGKPLTVKVDNLRCSEVRWLYENENGRLVPFGNEDSLKTEIRYRLRNGIQLDDQALLYYKDHPELGNCSTPASPVGSSQGGSSLGRGSSQDSGKGCVLVADGYYRVCKTNKWIYPVYWKNDTMKIVRGYYFTEDSKPIEEEVVKAINKNLERHFKQKNNPGEKLTDQIAYSDKITVGQTIIKFDNFLGMTIQIEGKNPMNLVRFPREATGPFEDVEIEQLVFVVHGIGHNEDEQGIVNNAKKIIAGVKGEMDKHPGIQFLPIHWRTNLEENGEHICDKTCSKENYDGKLNLILKDLRLYSCWFYGDKIRQRVLLRIRELYKTFKSNNPNFHGKVSFFGHSLGSLICYDILTLDTLEQERNNFEFKKVEKLFAVGSPLWFFIGEGGEIAQNKFKKALGSYRIFNVYHPTDMVASPLEPLLMREVNGLTIELPAVSKDASQPFASFLSSFVAQFKKMAHWVVGKTAKDGVKFELPHPIDHVLQSTGTLSDLQSHSIYWDHPSVFNFIKFVFARDSYTHQLQMVEQQSVSRMVTTNQVLHASSSFSKLVEQFLEAMESEEQEAMFQIYNYS